MPPRIPLPLALVLSLVLHAASLTSVLLARPAVNPAPPRALDVDLPPPEPLPAVDRVSTEAVTAEEPALPPPVPTMARGRTLQRTQSALARHLLYPPEAVEQGIEGDVVLLLVLDAGSRIARAEVARSSGHAILDQAALAAARRIGALPGNPPQTLFPVRFRLD
jgi:protein TonB